MADTITRYTDEDHTLRVKGFDFSAAEEIMIAFEQGGHEIFRVTDVDKVSSDTVSFKTTQEQTGALKTLAPAYLHLNWWKDGQRHAIKPSLKLTVQDNQPAEVISDV